MVHKSFQWYKVQEGRRVEQGTQWPSRADRHSQVWHPSLHGVSKAARDFQVFSVCYVRPEQSQAPWGMLLALTAWAPSLRWGWWSLYLEPAGPGGELAVEAGLGTGLLTRNRWKEPLHISFWPSISSKRETAHISWPTWNQRYPDGLHFLSPALS